MAPTYAEFATELVRTLARVDDHTATWRDGQAAFNVLADFRADLADAVHGTHLDPFHDDKRIRDFLRWTHQNWDRDPDDPAFDGVSLKISLEQYRRGELTDL